MKKVLITGGTGFIGANFVHEFVRKNYEVHIIARKNSDFWRINRILDKLHVHYLDLSNYEEIESLIYSLKPNIILHFAAYGTYPRRQKEIKLIIDTNLLGTVNLVNAASKIKFDCFINAGSSSEYGIKNSPMKETDFLEPNNIYGITKAAATMYCKSVADELKLPIFTLRFFSVYGPYEDKERLIPTVIKSFLKNKELQLSNPHSVRDFMFIEDAFKAYMKVIDNANKIPGQIFNISRGEQNSIDKIVEIIKDITKSEITPKYGEIKPAQLEPQNWVSDISKIQTILNWKPEYSLDQGLRKTIEWFKENIDQYE